MKEVEEVDFDDEVVEVMDEVEVEDEDEDEEVEVEVGSEEVDVDKVEGSVDVEAEVVVVSELLLDDVGNVDVEKEDCEEGEDENVDDDEEGDENTEDNVDEDEDDNDDEDEDKDENEDEETGSDEELTAEVVGDEDVGTLVDREGEVEASDEVIDTLVIGAVVEAPDTEVTMEVALLLPSCLFIRSGTLTVVSLARTLVVANRERTKMSFMLTWLDVREEVFMPMRRRKGKRGEAR